MFASNDRDQESFDSSFNTMPWLALPFGDPTVKELAKHFDVHGIPCLIIIGPDGKTVTKQGRNLINLYQENAYPFTEAKVELLEKQMDEEAKSLPRSVYHPGHRHELNLVSEGNGGGPFICCDCDEQGFGWAYQCLKCGYEMHPKCCDNCKSRLYGAIVDCHCSCINANYLDATCLCHKNLNYVVLFADLEYWDWVSFGSSMYIIQVPTQIFYPS